MSSRKKKDKRADLYAAVYEQALCKTIIAWDQSIGYSVTVSLVINKRIVPPTFKVI